MLVPRNQKIRHRHGIKIANRYFEDVAMFSICNHTNRSNRVMLVTIRFVVFLSFSLLSWNAEVKIYKLVILPVVFMAVKVSHVKRRAQIDGTVNCAEENIWT
jgi:hypothetical protein